MYENMPINEFFAKYHLTLKETGLRTTNLGDKKQVCRNIAAFAGERGETAYSVALGIAYLERFLSDEEYDYNSGQPQPLKIRKVTRTIHTLNDFFHGLPFQRVYLRPKKTQLCERHTQLLAKFGEHMTGKGYAPSTVITFTRVALRLLEFFAINNIQLKELGFRDIERWMSVCYGFRAATIKNYLGAMKHLLRFLYEQGEIPTELSEKLPYAKVYRRTDIPSVWPKDDMKRIFDIIDTNSTIGKRNKLILLLASQLGMRGCDIRNLKLSDIDWDYDEIRFIQSKTQQPCVLPLIPEVGEAIVEYLRYGRPQSNCPEIILRHNAPFEPFVSNAGFNTIIIRYAQKAGVSLSDKRKHGIHSFRHSFASGLLEQDVSATTIASLLGHMTTGSVATYLKTQDEALRECSIDVGEVIANG